MPRSIDFALPQANALPPFSRFVMTVAVTVTRWEMHLRTRKALERLDSHLLRDVGLDRGRAETEWNKPFWWD